MSEWKKCTIGELGKIITGKTPRTTITENYDGNIPFLTPSNNMDVKYVGITNKTLSEQGVREVKNCLLPEGAVCVSCIGSDLGKVLITTQPTVTNQQINSIIVNDENDIDFVYYLMTIVGKRLNIISKTSTAVPIINKSSFSNYKVTLPNIETQKKIAKILSSLDDKIETNRKINARLEELAQAIFKSWFIDFEPFGGKMPEDWNEGTAEDFFRIDIGKTPPRKENQWFSNNNKNITWISISDMGKSGMFISTSSEMLTKEAINKFKIAIVPQNTILLSFKLTVGRVSIANSELTTNEAIARFQLNNSFEREYLYFFLKEYDYNSLGSTSSIATAVNSKIIKRMSVIMPKEQVLKQFSALVSPLFNRIESLTKESTLLAKLRDTLLPRLMSGEIKVE
ncbi:MAG: restriction endonuclease subunit S [Muribaculaceae bacterium]|nr:restriction endonuclease subunit S [Muribaculaceae bacterium]